jgi:hypothetical protein
MDMKRGQQIVGRGGKVVVQNSRERKLGDHKSSSEQDALAAVLLQRWCA